MKKNKLTVDDLLLCRDILDLILMDSDLRKGFRGSVQVTTRQLERLSKRCHETAMAEMNGGTNPHDKVGGTVTM